MSVLDLPVGVHKITNIKGDKGDEGAKGDTGSIAFATAEKVHWTEHPRVSMVGPEAARGAHFEIPIAIPTPEAVNNDVATDALVRNPTLTQSSLKAMFGGFINVTQYGATGDGVTDDYPAIQEALDVAGSIDGGARVFIPDGVFMLSDELRVPDYVTLEGAGMFTTTLRTMAGVDKNACVVTNAGNSRVAHTEPNRGIRIANLTVDGNADGVTRDDVEVSAPWGSAITFACVEDSVIENVRAVRGNLHCIDISASVYMNPSPMLEYAPGPSRNIKIIDCLVEDPRGDDGITTHYSEYVYIRGCLARRTIPLRVSNQFGFEIDEGSRYITLEDCVSVGWNAGFQVKGHGGGSSVPPSFTGSVPASEVDLINCVADSCNYGFEIDWQASFLSMDDPVPSRNIRLIDCVSRRNTLAWSGGGTARPELYSLLLRKYQNVTVQNFRVEDTEGGGILVDGFAKIIGFDGVTFAGACTNLPSAAPQQFIALAGNSATVTLDRITVVDEGAKYPVVNVNSLGNDAVIGNIRAKMLDGVPTVTALSAAKIDIVGAVEQRSVDDVPLQIMSGALTGTYSGDFKRAPYLQWREFPLPAGWTGDFLYMRQGNKIMYRIDGVTAPDGTNPGVKDLGILPAGYKPMSVVDMATLEYSVSPPVKAPMWVNSNGLVRLQLSADTNVIHGSGEFLGI